ESAVILGSKEYQELLEQLARLKAQQSDKPVNPSFCELSGTVDNDSAHLTLQFKFRTDKPMTLVALGCPQAQPTAIAQDGQLPDFRPGDDGFVVVADKPGEHLARLELDTAVVALATDRGITLDLPHVIVTNLTLRLPDAAKGIRVGNRAMSDPQKLRDSRLTTGPLGTLGRLEIAWKGPPQAPVAPLLEAEGRIVVRVSDSLVTTQCDLTLRVLRGQTAVWRLQVPPQADIRVWRYEKSPSGTASGDDRLQVPDERVLGIEGPDPKGPVRVIRLREPSAEPLHVTVRSTHARGAGGSAPPA